MPRRITRKAIESVDQHANTIIFILFAIMVITAIFAALGWNTARRAQATLTQEKIGKQIADVTTCFNQAKSRPRLIVILRGIQVELEPDPRQALAELIDEYEQSTPSIAECVVLAEDNNIDPGPYLQEPPADAGTSTREEARR